MLQRKTLYLVGLVVLIAAFASACGPGGGGSAGGSGGQTYNVQGSEFSYAPADISAKPGEKVTINFKNAGTVQHTFVIKDLNFKLVADPGQTVTGSFTAPSAAGVHDIHCDIAGHTEAGMQAKLTVQ